MDPTQFLTIDVKTDEGNLGDDSQSLVSVENTEDDDGAISEQEGKASVQEEKDEGRKIQNGELHCDCSGESGLGKT